MSASVPTFVQNSRVGQTFFQIRGDTLAISEPLRGGGFADREVDLRTIDSNYQPRSVRLHRLLIVPGIMAVLAAGVIWGLVQIKGLPDHAILHFIQWPVLVFALSLGHAIRGSRQVEYFLFCDHWKKAAFSIVCERNQRDDCAAFMSHLVAAIEASQSGIPATERARLVTAIEAENRGFTATPNASSKWKFALGSGLLACGLPWLLWFNHNDDIEILGFVAEFSLCVAGPTFSFYSFQAREPHRWWSLPGAALALVPVFFYS